LFIIQSHTSKLCNNATDEENKAADEDNKAADEDNTSSNEDTNSADEDNIIIEDNKAIEEDIKTVAGLCLKWHRLQIKICPKGLRGKYPLKMWKTWISPFSLKIQ